MWRKFEMDSKDGHLNPSSACRASRMSGAIPQHAIHLQGVQTDNFVFVYLHSNKECVQFVKQTKNVWFSGPNMLHVVTYPFGAGIIIFLNFSTSCI